MIPVYRTFVPNFFNFGIISVLSIFEIFVASKVLTFAFHCGMPQKSPVGEIRRPSDQVEDIAVARYFRLWYCGRDGSLWFHPILVINISPVSGNISTTIQNPNWEVVPITVYWYGLFLEVDNVWLNSGVCIIHCVSPKWVCDSKKPSYFGSQKQYFSRFFCALHLIPSDIFPKHSGQL